METEKNEEKHLRNAEEPLRGWPGKLPPTARESADLYKNLMGEAQAFPVNTVVPLVVYRQGERHVIGAASTSGNGGSFTVFSNLPELIYEALKLGANEICVIPVPPIVFPKRLDEIGPK